MSKLSIVRMMSGEDVLCKLTDTGDSYSIEDAVVIVPTPNNSVQFVPWAPFIKKDAIITVPKDRVLFVNDPAPEFESHHRQMFSGLVIPEGKIEL